MATLTITAAGDLGPLSLRVVSAGGRLVEPPPPPLSSAQRRVSVPGLAEGTFVVIGTRPSGQTLTREVAVGPDGGEATFSVEGQSPNEFLHQAMQRGLVPPLPDDLGQQDHREAARSQMGVRVGASGDAGRALRAIGDVAKLVEPEIEAAAVSPDGFDIVSVGSDETGAVSPGSALFKSLSGLDAPRTAASQVFRLRRWTWADGRWRRDTKDSGASARPHWVDWGAGYVRLRLSADSGPRGERVQAFGLLDAMGYGPIVIAPPFRDGLDITFLADGLTAEGAAERVDNPSSVRVPVAVALPLNPMAADLLGGVTSAGLPGAEQIWSGQADIGDVDNAFDLLFHKYADPAAAVLGAHYLVRFTPKRIPVQWMRNLMDLLPDVADGPTLLAWRYMTAGGKQGAKVTRREIQGLLREASRRPVCYFARSRSLLSQGMRLYGPWTRNRRLDRGGARPPRTGDFLDVAADAGGLEAFWGASPNMPWRREPPITWSTPPLFEVRLRNGLFWRDDEAGEPLISVV
ncbi:MAG: hypothetical protein V4597_04135 [Pseudomonadota bacterium]